MSFDTKGQERLLTPTGTIVVDKVRYSSFESSGVSIIVVVSFLSLVCVVTLLGILGLAMFKQRHSPSEHVFVRTHAAAYFVSLMVADLLQAIGSIMSIMWVSKGRIDLGPYCNAQGAIKNAGNLSVAIWSLVLAIHVFCILFVRAKPREWVLYATLGGVWFFVGFIIILGPSAIQEPGRGPYFGISGFWCWIADPYPVERILMEYFWLYFCAFVSFALYFMTFLRLRGNLRVEGGKMKFVWVDSMDAWQQQVVRNSTDIQMTAVARGLLGFPVMYTLLFLPISVCRFVAWSGKHVPFEATIFADTVFCLTGVFDLILFLTTRSLFPRDGVSLFFPRAKISSEVKEYGVEPYPIRDFANVHGFNESQEGRGSLPARTSASLHRRSQPPDLEESGQVDVSVIPVPPTPEGEDTVYRKETMRTVGGNYIQDGVEEEEDGDFVWDMVDLDRSTTEEKSVAHHHRRSRRGELQRNDTMFSVSAYTYGDDDDEEADPPMSGIYPGSQSDYAEEEDDRNLTRPRRSYEYDDYYHQHESDRPRSSAGRM